MGRIFKLLFLVFLAFQSTEATALDCSSILSGAQKFASYLFRGGRFENGAVVYADGSQFLESTSWFGLVRRIEVTNPDGSHVSFNRTDRSLGRLLGELLYPPELLSLGGLKGQEVLDAGCGGGSLVRELRRHSINAVGADAFLDRWQRASPNFVQAMSADLPFEREQFDVVFSTWSSLSYEGSDPALEANLRMVQLLRELARVTKPGGVIRLSPVPFKIETGETGKIEVTFPQIDRWLAQVPELQISRAADAAWLSRYYYVETPSPRQEGMRLGASAWIELKKR